MYQFRVEDKPFIYALSFFSPLFRRWREWIDIISPKELFFLSENELINLFSGLSLIQEFIIFRRKFNWEKEWEKLEKNCIKMVTLWEEDFPPLLKEIKNPPPFLLYKGSIKGEKFIGIVGTRRPSAYGVKMAESFARELVNYGFVVVSGLAYGIDTHAHKGAIEGGGKTFAVLGSSLDYIYPSGNLKLAEKIIESGAIISEYPLGTRPARYTFPQRNRIISGICQGILVVEAGEKSGALITAGFAANEGRDVFAIPGRLTDEKSIGTNKLIRDGAKMVMDIGDILEEYNIPYEVKKGKDFELTEEEKSVLNFLGLEPVFIEDLMKNLNIDLSRLMFIIISLQGKGFVEEYPGLRYAKKRSVITDG